MYKNLTLTLWVVLVSSCEGAPTTPNSLAHDLGQDGACLDPLPAREAERFSQMAHRYMHDSFAVEGFAQGDDCQAVTALLSLPNGFREPGLAPYYRDYRHLRHDAVVIPDSLVDFHAAFELASRPRFRLKTAIPRFPTAERDITRVLKRDYSLHIAESVIDDEVIETEIIQIRPSGEVDFFVYDATGRLALSTTFGDRSISVPYACMTCHVDTQRGTFRLQASAALLAKRPERESFAEIAAECASCHNEANDLFALPFGNPAALRRMKDYLIEVVSRNERPMPPLWPLRSRERELFITEIERRTAD